MCSKTKDGNQIPKDVVLLHGVQFEELLKSKAVAQRRCIFDLMLVKLKWV